MDVDDVDESEWFKGKIYSVEVKNFVTYDSVVYYPGKYLNIILGPNGTGKSTLVAAIVLGMGGQPKTLSRSSNIEDYVKNGKESAEIEVYIYRDAHRKTKFKRKFNINGQNKYFVNNDECSAKKFNDVVAKYNIQINNLCQFLPQDRVQDFAKMNPQELLVNTQCSVCSSECVEMFEKLKELRAQQQGEGVELATQIKKLSEHECRVATMKEQIDNITLKSALVKSYEICCKKKAWMEFEELFIKFKEVENDLKISIENKKRAEDEYAPLEKQSKELSAQKQVFATKIKSETEKTQSLSKDMNKLDEKSCHFEETIIKAEADLAFMKTSHDDNNRELEAALLEHRGLLEDVKKAAANFDEKTNKTQIDGIMKERTVYTNQIRKLSDENHKVKRQLDEEVKPQLNSVNNKIQQMENSKNIKLEMIRTKFDHVYQAVIWLRSNLKKFKGKIYEPLILELNVRAGYSKYFENVISSRDMLAFSCEDNDDMKLMFRKLRNEMKLSVNIIAVKPVRILEFKSPPISEISEFGFNHFLLELVEGPVSILNFLCRMYRIHLVPLGTDYTFSVADRVPQRYSLFFTPNHRMSLNVSKYSKERSCESHEIFGHNLLNIAVDYGLLDNLKLQRDNVLRISDKCRNKQSENESEMKVFQDKINALDTQKAQIESKFLQVTLSKQKLQRQIKKIESIKASAVDLTKESEKFKKETEAALKSLTELHKQKLETLKSLNTSTVALKCHRELHRIFLQSKADLENRLTVCKERIENAIKFTENITKMLDELKDKCKKKQAEACKLTDNNKPSDAKRFPYKKQFDELPDTMEALVDHMNEIQGRIECVRDYNPEVVSEYEKLTRDIQRLKAAISRMQSNQNDLGGEMDTIHNEWYSILLTVVNQINDNFSNFMMSMGFAGEVELTRNNERDYAEYGISIRVKYRNNEQLQGLDRFVQSGGERAVAIAAYTLSLQHISHVPFRCVDEINQGMDPTNERRIFDMLVKETSQPGKSQFFFVTPKVLQPPTFMANSYGDRFIPRRCKNFGKWAFELPEELIKKDFLYMKNIDGYWRHYNMRMLLEANFGNFYKSKVLYFHDLLTKHACKQSLDQRLLVSHSEVKCDNFDWPCFPRKKPAATSNATYEIGMYNCFSHLNIMSWSQTGNIAASFGSDLAIWMPNERLITYHIKGITSLAYSSDGKFLACGITGDEYTNEMQIWDVSSDSTAVLNDSFKYFCKCAAIRCIEWDPKDKFIASGMVCGKINIHNLKSALKANVLSEHRSCITDLKFSVNRNYLASADESGHVFVRTFKTFTGRMHWKDEVRALIAWHPWKESYMIISSSSPASICLLDVSTEQILGYYCRSDFICQIEAISFNPISAELVVSVVMSGGSDCEQTYEILVLASLDRLVDVITLHESAVKLLMWSADGSELATAGEDNNLNITDFFGQPKQLPNKFPKKKNRVTSKLVLGDSTLLR